MVWLLPAGGVSIVLIYRICHMERDRGTNLVLVAVREAEPMKLRTAPLIFLSTIITHLVGGSAGREGAALQPVSYTHLDVYKRQGYGHKISAGIPARQGQPPYP